MDSPEAFVAFLGSASNKQLQQLSPVEVTAAQTLIWKRLSQEDSLHGVYEQARALSSLLSLQAKWKFPLETQSFADFLSRFLSVFVQDNALLWNEEHMRDCESVLQTLLKCLQQAATPLPPSTQDIVWSLLERATLLPKDICTQLGLLYHTGLHTATSERLKELARLSGQGKVAALRGIVFVSAAEEGEILLQEILRESGTADVSLKHYVFNVSDT